MMDLNGGGWIWMGDNACGWMWMGVDKVTSEPLSVEGIEADRIVCTNKIIVNSFKTAVEFQLCFTFA